MTDQSHTEQSLETLQDIKRMMERSSRFISLSGLSGVSAGVCALIGAWIAHGWIESYLSEAPVETYKGAAGGFRTGSWSSFEIKLVLLALAVLVAALATSTWFTWRKARKSSLPIWDHASKRLAINMIIPLAAGGFFVVGLLTHKGWEYVAPSCLIFYGLALVNASKYTLTDIRYLGLLEIALGCINMYYPHEGLYFWTAGFGILHIIYGLIMWWKYERS
ncbi:hypothetical protein [Puia dinghuensis]|uniref:Uncharacterized protein n=1 Tax=Puia dinghuensis TaxID=1792502 RepID=A0A8J2UGF2_9BACT|nr:hypothetical protein [Puia dinghuensis]GGB14114.1 hypothetical protein GCM10011511_42340 [Puia dinghuensis]